MVSTQTVMPPPAPPPPVSTSMSIQQPVNNSPSPVGVIAGAAPNSVAAVSQVHSHVTTSVQQALAQSPISMAQTSINVHHPPISVSHSQIGVPQHSSTCTVIPQQTIQTMAQSQLQPVQVIQQSALHNHAYLPQLYSAAQQQMLLPGNLTLGPHGMSALQSINLQLQGKPHGSHVDPTKAGQPGQHATATATIIPAVSIAGMAQTGTKGVQGVTISSAPTLVSSNGQLVAGGKPCLPGGQMLAKGATAMMGPAGYVPSTSTAAQHQHSPQHQQTLVINHLGLLSSHQGLLPAQAAQGAKPMEPQKGKPYCDVLSFPGQMVKHAPMMSHKVPTSYSQVMSQQTPLQPKSPLLTSQATAGATAQVQQSAGVTTAQVLNPNQFKQLQQGSQHQLISSQPPATVISQAQLLGSLQALNATFPHGITWANPGQLQSPTAALLTAQNPIYIRSQQPDMFLQQGGATLHAVPVAAPVAPPQQQQPQQVAPQPQPQQAPPIQPQPQHQQQQPIQPQQHQHQQHPQQQQQQQPKPKQVRPASSVATQTATSTAVTVNSHVVPSRPQAKPRARTQTNRTSPGPGHQQAIIHTQTANTQTQTFPAQQMQAQQQQQHHHHHQHQQNVPAHQFQHQMQQQQQQQQAHHHHHHPQVMPKADAANQTAVAPQQQQQQQNVQHQQHHHHHHQHPPIQPRILPEMKSTATQSVKTNVPIEPKPVPPQQSPHVTTSHGGVNHASSNHVATSHIPTSHVVSSHVTSSHSTTNHAVVAPQQKACTNVPSPPIAAPPPQTPVKTPSAEDKVEVSAPPEAAMPYDKQGGQQAEKMDAISNGGAVTPQMTMLTASEPVNQSPQKAVVKPNVLTHVIEGYIIQEGPEPFPVSRSSLIAESESPKPSVETNGKSNESDVLEQVAQGKVTKKKKVGRKSWRKMQGGRTPSYSTDDWTKPDIPGLDGNTPTGTETNAESGKGDVEMETVGGDCCDAPESVASPILPSRDEMEVDAPEQTPALPSKSPRTWTVQEVADYIQELPGCTDYAEEFRSQEIDGQALLLLKEDHLMSAMNIKLGPALKICAKINALREEQ